MDVTTPFALTVATVSSVDSHVIFLFNASSGSTLAVNIRPEPHNVRVAVLLQMTTAVTGSETTLETETAQVSVKPPSPVVTMILASPLPTGVTVPLVWSPDMGLTVATDSSVEVHVSVLSEGLFGVMVATSRWVLLLTMLSDFLLRLTPTTSIFSTVTTQVSVKLPCSVLTMILAVPAPFADTEPPSTVATLSSVLV